jgi:hypothetical protein
MINSIESDRLQRLIDRKEASYKKMKEEDPDNPALKYLNSEITLLRDEILPIILCNTVTDYVEIRNFVTKSLRKLERHPLARSTNDLLVHIHLKDSGVDKPLAALASNLSARDVIINDIMINEMPRAIWPMYYSTPNLYTIDHSQDYHKEEQWNAMRKIISR